MAADDPFLEEGPPSSDPLQRLTAAFEAVLKTQAKPAVDPLDKALEGISGGSAADGAATGLSTRRGQTAWRLLVRAVADDPDHFIKHIETAMNESFHAENGRPGTVGARDYLEYRSSLGPHRGTASWMWAIAGIYDALAKGKPREAQARCGLALIAGEQCGLDAGSWTLAQELLFETSEPPFHQFAARDRSTTRLPFSRLADSRWIEVAVSRLRELASFNEVKRRLAKAPAGAPPGLVVSDGAYAKTKFPPKKPAKSAAVPPP